MLLLLGIALASLFWSPGFDRAREKSRKHRRASALDDESVEIVELAEVQDSIEARASVGQIYILQLDSDGSEIEKCIYANPWSINKDIVGLREVTPEDIGRLAELLEGYVEVAQKNQVIGWMPPKIIDRVVAMERDTLRELMQSYDGEGCAWQKPIQRDLRVIYGGDVERASLLPAIVNGCRLLAQPVCYLERETRKHPKVSCVEECGAYQRAAELMQL